MSSNRQLAAIMFTDMVGYTALMQKNEALARQQRDKNKQVFENCLAKYEGKLLQYYGDGTLSIFNSAANAVQSAVEMQTLCRQEKVELRIGIHSGDVMFDDTGVYGDSVNVASRIESLAVPGSVFISEKLFSEISNQGIDAKPLGYFELKNVQQPMQVYAVSNPGIVVPSRDEVKGKVKQTLNSIAVLPFASLSSEPENEFFCDGITEELLNVLAKIDGLQVTSRTSSFSFKGKTEDIREIAAKLNVQKVLEGSVRKAGSKVRITAQLINAADGYHLWSETYDRSIEDIFAVQDDIAREIANKFRLNLNESDFTKEIVKAPTENIQAYMKYLQGVTTWYKGSLEQISLSMEMFEEATRLDPMFADPYSYIAFLSFAMGENGLLPLKEAAEKCRVAASRALSIAPSNPHSLLASGIYKMMYAFEWEGAREMLEKSLALNPNSSFTWSFYSIYKHLMRDYKDIDDYAKRIRVIDPLDAFSNGMIASLYMYSNQLERAKNICTEFSKISPETGYMTMIGIFVTGFTEGWQSVIPTLEQVRDQYGPFPMLMATLGLAYATHAETEKAKECISWFQETEKQRPGIVVDHVAIIYASLGMMEEFFTTMENGIANCSIIPAWIYKSPFLPENISNDDRMRNIRIKMGLPV